MEVWTWIVAYVVGFSLLQLLVYRYFRDRGSVEGDSAGTADGYGVGVDAGEAANPRDSTGDGVHCQQCGAHNESRSQYRYCRECAAPLR